MRGSFIEGAAIKDVCCLSLNLDIDDDPTQLLLRLIIKGQICKYSQSYIHGVFDEKKYAPVNYLGVNYE